MTLPGGPRRTRLGLALAALAMLVGACSSGGAEPDRTTSTAAATTTTLPPRFPLTGLVASGVEPGVLERPALSVKIENSVASRPQSGLGVADVVYEEVVEGGQTRFIAVFHSTDSELLGPIRSVRPTDPDVVSPLGGLFSYSGGTAPYVAKLRQAAGLVDVGFDAAPDSYRRRSDRRAPHNLYSSTGALYALDPGGLPAPQALWDFAADGSGFEAAGAADLISVELQVGSSTRASYTWDASVGGWLRETDGRPHLVENGLRIAPTNVIVQFVDYRDSGGRDTTGAVVLEADVIGEGEAIVLSGGKFVRGRWSKPSAAAPTRFTDASGAPVRLIPGRTWVELVAPGSPLTLVEPAPPEPQPTTPGSSTP